MARLIELAVFRAAARLTELFVFVLLALPVFRPAHAAPEAAAARADGLPPFCEFTVKFPEAPMISHRCADAAGTDCYTAASFTRVYDLQTSVNVRVSCNPVEPAMVPRYTEEVMKKTLESMARDKPVGQYTLNSSEKEWWKAATLFGEGSKGLLGTLYVAQIWIGKTSILTVEGELSGPENTPADSLFSEILKSIKPSAPPQAEEEVQALPPKK